LAPPQLFARAAGAAAAKTTTTAAARGSDGAPPPPPPHSPQKPRRPSPGDRRRATRAAIAARRSERRRAIFGGGAAVAAARERNGREEDDDEGRGDDNKDQRVEGGKDGAGTPSAAAAAAAAAPRPLTVAERRAAVGAKLDALFPDRPAFRPDPAAMAALDRLELAAGARMPAPQAAALLHLANTQLSARFDAAMAAVEAEGGGRLAELFAAASGAERARDAAAAGAPAADPQQERERRALERDALVAEAALDRTIWDFAARALTREQRAVLEKVVGDVPLHRAPDYLARAMAGGLDPVNAPSRKKGRGEGGGDGDEDEDEDEEGPDADAAAAVAERLGRLTEADGVHLERAVASLAAMLSTLRASTAAVEGAAEQRRQFEASLIGMAAEAEAAAGGAARSSSSADADAAGRPQSAAGGRDAARSEDDDSDSNDGDGKGEDEAPEPEGDPLQRRIAAYAKYARLLSEGGAGAARRLWYAAGGEPSALFLELKDVARRMVELSLVVPELAHYEEARGEAAAGAWRAAYERALGKGAEAGGGSEAGEADNGGGEEGAAAAAEDAADRAARLAAKAFDAAHPDGADLARAAEKLRAARRDLRRAARGGGEDGGDEDADDEDEDEDDDAFLAEPLSPLSDEETVAAFEALGDRLAGILESIQAGSDPQGKEEGEEEEEADDDGRGRLPGAAGRWGPRRGGASDARSAALYLAALTDDDGAFDASPANLARLCRFLRAAEALEALKALAAHGGGSDEPWQVGYGTQRGTAAGRRHSRAAAASAGRPAAAGPGAPQLFKRPPGALQPVDDAAAVRLAGLDRDDWFVPPLKREAAWAAVRAAEMDASFAARAAASYPSRRPAGFGKGPSKGAKAGGAPSGSPPPPPRPPPPPPPAPPQNALRALLRFGDEARIAELAALDSDDLLFLADMERTGWDEDDCLCKWTLHPRVGPRLRATAAGGGLGGEGGGGFGFGAAAAAAGEGGRLERGARGGAGAFFGGLPDSLRTLMDEARAASAEESSSPSRQAGGGGAKQ